MSYIRKRHEVFISEDGAELQISTERLKSLSGAPFFSSKAKLLFGPTNTPNFHMRGFVRHSTASRKDAVYNALDSLGDSIVAELPKVTDEKTYAALQAGVELIFAMREELAQC